MVQNTAGDRSTSGRTSTFLATCWAALAATLLGVGLPQTAAAQFTDTFDRPDGAAVGNGWIEKSPAAFQIDAGAAEKNAVGTAYRDNIVYRPAAENLLDSEASVEFRLTNGSPGYPQIFTRVQTDTVGFTNTLDAYILYINNSSTQAVLGRQTGSSFVSSLATLTISPGLNTTDNYRLRLRTTGTNPVQVSAWVERWNGTGWDVIGQATADDAAGARIQTAGSTGFGGYIESSYIYDNFTVTNLGSGSNPTPVLASISPNSVVEGSSAFSLTVNGSDFIAGSVVRWNGADRQTTYVSPTEMQAAITAADVAAAGTASVTVFSPAPGGGSSAAQTFTIDNAAADNPVPVLTAINPNNAVEGSSAFALTVTGSDFIAGSVVRWNGADRQTTYVSPTELQAAITAADIAAAGTASVTVFSPAPGGGSSATQTFTIDNAVADNPVPVLTAINPNNVDEGSSAFALAVTGADFVPGSVVRWNGADRQTTYVSPTELQATITAADVATAGNAAVTVFTPTPGGGTSAAQTFTIDPIVIDNPVPVLTSIDPTNVLEGSGSFVLTAFGTDFTADSTVRWDGLDRTTTFISSNEIRANIPASDVATPGTANITVSTPAPGGGLSASRSLTVDPLVVANPAPDLISVSPVSAQVGDTSATLTAIGEDFTADSSIAWNGQLLNTTFVSSQTLEATIDSSRLDTATVGTITVVTPTPGGGISDPYPFFVLEPDSAFFFDDFNSSDNPQLGNQWTEKNPGAFRIEDNMVRGQFTWEIYLDNIAYRPPAEDRQNVELGVEFTRTYMSGFAQLHARVQRDTVTLPEVLRSYIFYIDDTRPPPGAAVIAVGHNLPSINECNILPMPFDSPLEIGGQYRLRFRVTGANPVLLEGDVDQFIDGQWQTVVSGSILHDENTTPDPYFCGPGYVPEQIVGAGATGISKWIDEADDYDNYYWIDLGGSTVPPPLPQVGGLSPDSIDEGSPGFNLLVSGNYFVPGSIVRWDGADLPTTYISPTDLQAAVSAADIATAGTVDVRVFNPGPDGGLSNIAQFDVVQPGSQPNPNPTLDSISPSSVTAGASSQVVTVTGSDFVTDSVVRLNGVDLVTSYISPTTLAVTLDSGDLAVPGTAAISVSSPAPGGGTSAIVPLHILAANEFFDDFQRADSNNPQNGWTEKAPGAFSILNGALEKLYVNTGYRDNVAYRPSSENALDNEVSVTFSLDNGVPGYPQLFSRLQAASVAQPDTLDGYIMYANNNASQFILGRQTGSSFVTSLGTLNLPAPLFVGETYRMRMVVTGTSPVQISAYIERLTENGYEILGEVTVDDTSGARINTAGAGGIGGYIESGYRYDDFRHRPLP
ncbi:MAG: hypothetical protein QNI99_09575 [Woeseiaceae bacterium]|nr:hypothetical protein [Woeseiaceae bacterium]